jgi:hypothetical protein
LEIGARNWESRARNPDVKKEKTKPDRKTKYPAARMLENPNSIGIEIWKLETKYSIRIREPKESLENWS